ncbi:MAG: hypothetical protein ACFCU3_03940 [Verrucomicrobiales bacterium]
MDEPSAATREMVFQGKDSQETLHVDEMIQLSNFDFKKISLREVEFGEFSILIELTKEGSQKFADLTRVWVGKRIAITAGSKVLAAPVILQPITGGSMQITGHFSKEESEELIRTIKRANRKR